MENIRVRFAPSPTGPLHIGGVRTALYNYLFAKKHNGVFILRIEDTDQTRYVAGAEKYIRESIHWCGFDPQEGPEQGGQYGPYRQSERREIYAEKVAQLIENGKAYYAFDTKDDLEEMRQAAMAKGNAHVKYDATTRLDMRNSLTLGSEETRKLLEAATPYVVRMLVPENQQIVFKDEIRGDVTFESKELDDKVILKADGLPTYHLANVVDDYMMKISHVIRGEEWLSSTPHHVLLYNSFGWESSMPKFAHLPLILKPSGKEWTDPDPSESFEGFRSMGFLPEALVNFLAFLGWNPGTEQEVFEMDGLIDAFAIDQIGKSGARFDYDKALWFNAQYIANQSAESMSQSARSFLEKDGYSLEESKLRKICTLVQDRLKTYSELSPMVSFLFNPVESYDQRMLAKKWTVEVRPTYQTIIDKMSLLDGFLSPEIKDQISQVINESEFKFGDLLPLIRIGLSGEAKGPDLFEIMEILGQKEVVSRMTQSIKIFDQVVLGS
ncbi:UNVERIFIED_CONTAM: hypothetical protein GTU68_047678 [Idotea baltica]|nr:hypothetical protein [Idotea baltica]